MTMVLVLDVGKTHVKLQVLDESLESLFRAEIPNQVQTEPPYPHYGIESLWQWLMQTIAGLEIKSRVDALCITTHGATAALIDRTRADHGLALPILDYEYTGTDSCIDEYLQNRPDFSATQSPQLPAGLNLGRQLHWLQSTYPNQFAQATDILLYPQYWAWRFSGQACTEVTSLGCHTDLWEPQNNQYSSLVTALGWQNLLPGIVPAWRVIGNITSAVSKRCGLNTNCKVLAGVHDSNASFLRYLQRDSSAPFTVISTGTWTIAMASGSPLSVLDARHDMLANVDVRGRPIACSRFMGGREYETICVRAGAKTQDEVMPRSLQYLIDKQIMALPNFSDGSGPFPTAKAEFIGPVSAQDGPALATLYCALVMDYQLDLLAAKGDIYIEGSFLKNAYLCELLAQLRVGQAVKLSSDNTGTVQGCAMLAFWGNQQFEFDFTACHPSTFSGLENYRAVWRKQVLGNTV